MGAVDAILAELNIAKYGLNDTSGVGVEDLEILGILEQE